MTFAQWAALPESEQEWWLARHRREAARHSCGHSKGECADPDKPWFPQLDVCYATMERQAAQERFDRLHKDRPWHDGSFPDDPAAWSAERSAEHPYHYSWGTSVFVAPEDMGLGGDFLRSGLDRVDEVERQDSENQDHE